MSTTRQSRIAPLLPPYDPAIEAVLKQWMPPGAAVEPLFLFRVLAHHTELMSRMRPLGSGILGSKVIEPAERELLINRTCARCGCEYEWGVHVAAFGAAVGLSPEKLASTFSASSEAAIWSAKERLLIRLVDELHDHASIRTELWESLEEHWEPHELIEMIVVVGWYHTIAYLANAMNLPLESWSARFPSAKLDRAKEGEL